MRQRKYTLPRHTNLARQSTRTSAFFVDLALTLALTFGFVYAIFMPIFRPKMNHYNNVIEEERINSGLFYKNEDGEASTLPDDQNVPQFIDAMEYYYFHYLPGVDLKEGLSPSLDKRTYEISWFNETILEIDESSPTSYFRYQRNGEEIDYTKVGVMKEDARNDLAYKFITSKYKEAIIYDFNFISNVKEAGERIMVYSTISYVTSLLVAGAIIYILFPFIFKNGQTIGKRIFKLGLANSDGYVFSSPRLFMRFLPFLVVDLSFLILLQFNFYIVLTIVLIIFLVSFTLTMSSPKRMSLHDYTGQTIVIDLKTSTLFKTPQEEEAYILKEDNLLDEQQIEIAGEEPELKYEK